jgi:DNA processing protein
VSADLLDRLRLIRTPGIRPIAFRQLLLRFGTASDALAAIPDLARRGRGSAPKLCSVDAAQREIAAAEALGARFLSIGHGLYPRALAELENAPPLITAKGRFDLLDRPMVAIVGARNASAAACRFARGLAHELGREGVAVVSGLARGIDTAAHDGSIEEGTIAVIAGGIDVVYPPENAGGRRIFPSADCCWPKCRPAPSRGRATFPIATGSSPACPQAPWWSRPRRARAR